MLKPIKDKNDACNYYQTPISIQDKADFGCTEQDKETLKYINSSDKEQRLVNIDKILLEAEDLKEITQQGTWLKQDVSTLIVNCHIST